MKYKVGDKVRIKSRDWYNEYKDINGNVYCGCEQIFNPCTARHCGQVLTIKHINSLGWYEVEEEAVFVEDGMIEGLVEEETPLYKAIVDKNGNMTGEFIRLKGVRQEINLPEGYIFKDNNGSVINTTKIILEKKKKKYPKTYEECSLINGCEGRISLKIIGEFIRLINARNAYWKIAGEEMGLEKSWEPDFNHINRKFYCIYNSKNNIVKNVIYSENKILIFPTAEMRDEFYENFKDLIERCKELL